MGWWLEGLVIVSKRRDWIPRVAVHIGVEGNYECRISRLWLFDVLSGMELTNAPDSRSESGFHKSPI